MRTALVGLVCLLFFAIAQAVRDAFFGSVFQSVSFLAVAILAFGASTLVFGAWAWWRRRGQVNSLLGFAWLFLALNATTAAAWLSYFFALKHAEPAIVNTLYTGIGPITVLVLSVLGVSMAGRAETGLVERFGYGGILLALIAIGSVAVLGQSGLTGPQTGDPPAAVLAAVSGGMLIAIGHMIARHLGDHGIGSDVLMGLRFALTFGIAVVLEYSLGEPAMRPGADALPVLALAAFGLIVIPSYFLQLGIARTSPLAVNIVRSLGPVFVFAAQQFDGRVRFSGATLVCILAFVFFAILSSALRAWAEVRRPSGRLQTGTQS